MSRLLVLAHMCVVDIIAPVTEKRWWRTRVINGSRYQARCSCGWIGGVEDFPYEAIHESTMHRLLAREL